MVREYSPTQMQVIIGLCHIHGIIMGEAGFGKLLFKQFAKEVFTLKTMNWTGFLALFSFSVVAFTVQVLCMLLLFIMYEQEDALYIMRFGGHCWYYS